MSETMSEVDCDWSALLSMLNEQTIRYPAAISPDAQLRIA
jgi:hypothetical protein